MKSVKFWMLNWMLNMTIFFFLCNVPLFGVEKNPFQKSHQESHQEKKEESTYEERKSDLNKALFLYHTLEQKGEDQTQALGNTYFQLGEYARAILYYQRAVKRNPNNPFLLSQLEKTQRKLGVYEDNPRYSWMAPFLKLSQRYNWILFIAIMTFLLISLAIWVPLSSLRRLAWISSIFTFLLLTNVFVIYYATPLEGILLKTTTLYREPNQNHPLHSIEPLLEGSKVEILQMSSDGKWLKVQNSSGLIGYIPSTRLCTF